MNQGIIRYNVCRLYGKDNPKETKQTYTNAYAGIESIHTGVNYAA